MSLKDACVLALRLQARRWHVLQIENTANGYRLTAVYTGNGHLITSDKKIDHAAIIEIEQKARYNGNGIQ